MNYRIIQRITTDHFKKEGENMREDIYKQEDENGKEWYIIEHLDYYLMNAFRIPSYYELDEYKEKMGAIEIRSKYLGGYGFESEEKALRGIEIFEELASKEGTECFKNGHVLDVTKKDPEHFASCAVCDKIIGWWCTEETPNGICEYDEESDPCHDNCLHCHEPEERK